MLRAAWLRATRATPQFRKAVSNCTLILSTNNETTQVLEEAGAKCVRLFVDNGVPEGTIAERIHKQVDPSPVVLHWSGRMEPRKGLPLAIEALAAASDASVRLDISGQGPLREKCEALVKRLRVEKRVRFLGFVARETLQDYLRESDALLITSLRDSFGSIALEAAAQGTSIIALDHQGVGALLPRDASWKVPVSTPRATVAALSQAIREVASSPADRIARANAVLCFARSNTWEKRARQMEAWYEQYC